MKPKYLNETFKISHKLFQIWTFYGSVKMHNFLSFAICQNMKKFDLHLHSIQCLVDTTSCESKQMTQQFFSIACFKRTIMTALNDNAISVIFAIDSWSVNLYLLIYNFVTHGLLQITRKLVRKKT